VRRAAEADAAGLRQPFEPRRDVYPVPEDVPVLEDDVAKVDADAKYDPLFVGRLRVLLPHTPLHRDRTGDGLDDARKFDQQAVASGLDDAALVLGNLGIDEFAAVRLEPCQSAGFVRAHQPRIAGDVGSENGRETAFNPLSAQCSLPDGRHLATSGCPEIKTFSLLSWWKPFNGAWPSRNAWSASPQPRRISLGSRHPRPLNPDDAKRRPPCAARSRRLAPRLSAGVVDLEIAQRRAQDRGVDTEPIGAADEVADDVVGLGRASGLDIEQH